MRRDLRGLQKETAEKVARHLVAAGSLVDVDPGLALEHARYARRRASRIAAVREAAGIAAYHAGEWSEALGELRAARRMGGGPGHLAMMADIERGLGRPERALELTRSPEARELDRAETIELAIVAAGARRDLGELDAAVVGLQIDELDPTRSEPWSARLFYAYADNLLAVGRDAEALEWFVHAADVDDDGDTDAAHRISELTGEALPDEGIEFGLEDDGTDLDPDGVEDAPAHTASGAVDDHAAAGDSLHRTATPPTDPAPPVNSTDPADLTDPTNPTASSDAAGRAGTSDPTALASGAVSGDGTGLGGSADLSDRCESADRVEVGPASRAGTSDPADAAASGDGLGVGDQPEAGATGSVDELGSRDGLGQAAAPGEPGGPPPTDDPDSPTR